MHKPYARSLKVNKLPDFLQATRMVLANMQEPAKQHHLLRAVATAAALPGDATTAGGRDFGGNPSVLSLASALEAGRPISEAL